MKKINVSEIQGNIFKMVGEQWMLITGGDANGFNSMTASWGGAGILWGKPVAHCYVRPQRYTRGFMDAGDTFTLTFYPEKYRELMGFNAIFGGRSGRDVDKVAESGFTPVIYASGAVGYEEAELTLVCRKLYADDFKAENFTAPETAGIYPQKDYHRFYIGEILEVYTN
ncbi:MAG: flavin reductase family protein [Oscillospiraceae bacterium]|jgi:flavin reductase (DIM6/NTAB) family NADH-FMN oxidoreductase RutF|nr:flavin reductase family protein [Oscillospiraceae bacterium]